MHQVKWFRIALMLLLVLGLATSAVAQPRPLTLSDSQEPGSVIVFPKFIYNPPLPGSTAATGPSTIGGEPRSEFEISVVCPPALRDPNNGTGCLPPYGEGFRIKIRAHWVCPADQTFDHKYICKETDFDLFTTVYGTVSFNPANVGAGAFPVASASAATGVNGVPTVFSSTITAQRVPAPPCPQGYLIAWVVDANDRPIKFDALIGDAIIREPSGAASAYNATPIQANPLLPQFTPAGSTTPTQIPFASGAGELAFDGAAYQALPGSVTASLRFEQLAPAAATTPFTTVRTDLTLLTLDVDSNAPNNPTFVELDFFNANEFLVSTFWEFICWTEVRLTAIDPNLTLDGMTTRKGLVVSGPAQKFTFLGPAGTDEPGPATLLGLVTTEITSTTSLGPPVVSTSQAYTYQLFNDSIPVFTEFEFKPVGVE
jgi:hypothetical protein